MNIFSKKAFYIAFKGLCYAIFCSLRGLHVSWRKLNFRNNGPVLLFTVLFTKRRTLKFKAAFTIDFFAAVNYDYNHKQWAYEPQKHSKRMEINQSQTMTFWTRQVLVPKRSAKMIAAVKNANVCWLLNFRICMFLKSAAILYWGIETVSCHLLI